MESILDWLSQALTQSLGLALLASAAWGALSVLLSPCHLATVPLAIAFLGKRADGDDTLRRQVGRSFLFALGVLGSLVAVGAVTLALGRIAGDLWGLGPWLGAALLLLAGLAMLDILPLPGGWTLDQDRVPAGPRGAVVLGVSLGVTLGPCTFAYMAPILAVTFAPDVSSLTAAVFLAAFGVGHTLALAVAGLFGIRVGAWMRSTDAFVRWGKAASGVALVAAGLYMVATAP